MFWPLLSPHFAVIWPAHPWKADHGGLIWLSDCLWGWRGSPPDAKTCHDPSLLCQVGCANLPLHPKQATYQSPKQELLLLHVALAKSGALAPLFFELLGLAFPMCQAGKAASEALAETPSMAPASWKLMICSGELQRKLACAPSPGARNWEPGRQHRAHPHPGGASRQSKGRPELLRKPAFFVPFFWW